MAYKLRIKSNELSLKSEIERAEEVVEDKKIAPYYIKSYLDKEKGYFALKTEKELAKNEFILWCYGEVKENVDDEEDNHYSFEFEIIMGRKILLMDASKENNQTPNVIVRSITIDDGSYPCFFAIRDIKANETLEFTYGEEDCYQFWRKNLFTEEQKSKMVEDENLVQDSKIKIVQIKTETDIEPNVDNQDAHSAAVVIHKPHSDTDPINEVHSSAESYHATCPAAKRKYESLSDDNPKDKNLEEQIGKMMEFFETYVKRYEEERELRLKKEEEDRKYRLNREEEDRKYRMRRDEEVKELRLKREEEDRRQWLKEREERLEREEEERRQWLKEREERIKKDYEIRKEMMQTMMQTQNHYTKTLMNFMANFNQMFLLSQNQNFNKMSVEMEMKKQNHKAQVTP